MVLNLICNLLALIFVIVNLVQQTHTAPLQIAVSVLYFCVVLLRVFHFCQWKAANSLGLRVSLGVGIFVPTLKYHLIRTNRPTKMDIKWLIIIDFCILVLEAVCFCIAAVASIASTNNLDFVP